MKKNQKEIKINTDAVQMQESQDQEESLTSSSSNEESTPKIKVVPESPVLVQNQDKSPLLKPAKQPHVKHWHVFLYVPNLVDYLRYFLAIRGMYYAFVQEQWMYFIAYYAAAILMDAFDGKLARMFNQESRLGCCLDMVCDRAQVSMMYLILAQVYPKAETILIFFFLLDYGSHFLQFTANALTKNQSHKNMSDPAENYIVRLYYSNFAFFALIATGADAALVLSFLYGRYPILQEYPLIRILTAFGQGIISVKMFININQWTGSTKKLRSYDKDRSLYEKQSNEI